MNVTQRELDVFVDEVERLGYSVRYAGINGFGNGEVTIDRNGAGDPMEWEYDIKDIVWDMQLRDFDITSYTQETIVITLY